MARKRYFFKKWDHSKDYTKCDICKAKTLHFVLDKQTGEEWWCCEKCYRKRYKIKKIRKKVKAHPSFQKKAIFAQKPLIKNSLNNAFEEAMK